MELVTVRSVKHYLLLFQNKLDFGDNISSKVLVMLSRPNEQVVHTVDENIHRSVVGWVVEEADKL